MAGLGDIHKKVKGPSFEPLSGYGNDVVERANGLIPLGKYSDGNVRPAWPSWIAEPARAAWNAWESASYAGKHNDPETTAAMARGSFDAASLAPIGGALTSAVPEGAVAANGMKLAANSPTGASVPLAVNAMEQSAPKGFTAYHGSPHDFDKFDLSKIGTGEGAQVYGHGLYFAENEGVAKAYRDTLTKDSSYRATLDGAPIDNVDSLTNFERQAVNALDRANGDAAKARQELIDFNYPEGLRAFDDMTSSGRLAPKQAGHMYEVNIKADPEQFLDWDKPLGQQPESVRRALEAKGLRTLGNKSTGDDTGWTSVDANVYKADGVPANDEGAALIDRLNALYGRDPSAMSQGLREAGIPGIRYLDQGSRSNTAGLDQARAMLSELERNAQANPTPDNLDMLKIAQEKVARLEQDRGSRNYVLFDDSLVGINRKYANHPFGAIPSLAASEDPQAEGYASGGSVTIDDFMKRHEGFAPRAQWDYAQHTNGYGTKARYPGEEISREEAELRFQAEKAQARAIVERFAPQLDEGSKAALTDLTYNAGDKWTRSGLGEAVRSGDLDRAKSLYLQYTKAGGETLPGLVRRRQEGAALFGSQMPDQTPRLAQSAPQGDFFADKPLTLAGNEMPAWGPPMALGGPEEPNISAEAKSSPFNAQSYRVAPEHQGRHSDYMKDPSGADWVQGPLGLMPKYSDGSMPLQGFAEGGMVRLETPLQGGNGVSSAMGELQPGYSGPLHSEIAGRTDEIPLEVSSGSYIVPADIVSALGQGNTLAGSKILQQMFPSEAPTLQFSSGGRVPIIVAGGEFALSPEQVAKIGGGDLNAGHSALDEWIGAVRAHTIQTLSSLPPPATE